MRGCAGGVRGETQAHAKKVLADVAGLPAERALDTEWDAFMDHWASINLAEQLDGFFARRPARK